MGDYRLTVLCGGRSLMLVPKSFMEADPSERVRELGVDVLRSSSEMAEFMYEGVKVTLYPNGGLMFYHLNDPNLAERYADTILYDRV